MKSNASPEESAEWSEQEPSRQHLCPAYDQITCWYNNLAKGGDGCHSYQDQEAPHHAWRISPQVQLPDAVHKVGRPRIGERQSHSPRWKNNDLRIHEEAGQQWWLAESGVPTLVRFMNYFQNNRFKRFTLHQPHMRGDLTVTPGKRERPDWLLCTSNNLRNCHLIDVHSSQSEISSHREDRRFSYIIFYYVTWSTHTSFTIDILGTPKGSVYRVNNNGLSMEPSGTPWLSLSDLDLSLSWTF